MRPIFILSVLIVLLSLAPDTANGQEVEVQLARKTLDDQKKNGHQVDLVLSQDMVEKTWKNHLRQYGKVKRSGSTYTVELADVPGLAVSSGNIYSMVSKKGKSVTVWWAIEENAGAYVADEPESANAKQAAKLLHDFAVGAYRQDIQKDIDDVERAVSKTVRDYDLNVRYGERLDSKLERQKNRQERLERKLEESKQEQERLTNEIEQNKKDQEKSLEEIDKMRGTKENIMKRLDKIN